jgi:phosphatidylglycerophosphatase A
MSLVQSDSVDIVNAIKGARPSDKIALIVSTWFSVGLLPGAPGTFGTIGSIPLFLLGAALGPGFQFVLTSVVIGVAIWSSWRAELVLKRVDAREIVIDEVAGFLLTVMFFPFTWRILVAGFFLFRFFDILKPPPIRRVEKIAKGGLGIVLDDLVAGVYAHICVQFLLYMLD